MLSIFKYQYLFVHPGGDALVHTFAKLIKSMVKVEGCTLHSFEQIYEYLLMAKYD